MPDWNSEQYLKFKTQRTQPAIDLAARLDGDPAEMIDLGCGPGNSTRVLKNRFPNAHITGADNSENMIEKARSENPDLDFTRLDISGDLSALNGKFDVVFSNACLQWLPNHAELLPKLFGLLRNGGTLAVQIPMNFDEPIHQIIGRVSESAKWSGKFPEKRIFGTLSQSEYFDILSGMTDDFEIWRTTYCHRMPSIESIIEWYRSTGLRTYLAALSEEDGAEFTAEISAELEREYPKQKNGEIIFKFPRFFFIAKK
ncbi:MAG: methyltransferase domain-containing protein [Lachnospiraceae bacterium]|nr:methyltransferase domain-containing protein [Ruminococcus sp.]MCM1274983.1 methyltransferase domain-containing protein [Lachnospiraceae bacterium]